jgi:uncharacterized RDD family membrane protein YckC
MDNAPAPVPAAAPLTVEPASFWVRGGASIIDAFILALSGLVPLPGMPILIGLAYKAGFVSQGGQTPGKMAAGIRVITADGEPVSVGRALGRAGAEYLSALTAGLGYLPAAFGEKRALHDYVAGTRVVNVDGTPAWRRVVVVVAGTLAPLAVIGVLAAVAIPQYARFKSLAAGAGTKGELGTLRADLAIRYGDTDGTYPASLQELVPKYAKAIEPARTADHPANASVTVYGPEVCTGAKGDELDASKLKDTGGWGYVVAPQMPCHGRVFVDCTHTDAKGVLWSSY